MNALRKHVLWLGGIAFALGMVLGCANKKPAKPSAKIPTRLGTQMQFRGVHEDGTCAIADVMLRADGVVVIVCK